MLEGKGVGRQAVSHQRFQLDLAEGAARALVAQYLLQADDIGRQVLDLFLRLVDHRQARHHRGEGLVGLLEALVEPLGDLAGDFVEPAVDRLRQLLHALAELRGHAFQRVLQHALLGASLFDQLFQHGALELAELAGDGGARFRQPLGLRDLQGRQLALHAVGLLCQARVQVGQHRAMAGFHVLDQQPGQAGLFAPQRMDAQQQQNGQQDEDGKADEKGDFDRTHGADFTRDPRKKARL